MNRCSSHDKDRHSPRLPTADQRHLASKRKEESIERGRSRYGCRCRLVHIWCSEFSFHPSEIAVGVADERAYAKGNIRFLFGNSGGRGERGETLWDRRLSRNREVTGAEQERKMGDYIVASGPGQWRGRGRERSTSLWKTRSCLERRYSYRQRSMRDTPRHHEGRFALDFLRLCARNRPWSILF